MYEEGPHRFALGLSNLTNLDKSEPGVVEQKNAFTIVKAQVGDSTNPAADLVYIKPNTVDGVVVQRFTMFLLDEDEYNQILIMAEMLSKHYPVYSDTSPVMIYGK